MEKSRIIKGLYILQCKAEGQLKIFLIVQQQTVRVPIVPPEYRNLETEQRHFLKMQV